MPTEFRMGVGSPGAGVPINCETPDMGAGDRTQVLYKSSRSYNTLFTA